MANYYTEFCFTYPVKNEQELQWALGLVGALGIADEIYGTNDPDYMKYKQQVDEFVKLYEHDYILDVAVSRYMVGDRLCLLLESDESGNPDHVAWFIHKIMQYFGHTEPISFEWANTCSRPKLDAFGGGAATVTPEYVQWHIPGDYAWEAMERYKRGFIGYRLYRIRRVLKQWRIKLRRATRKFRKDEGHVIYA